MFAALLIVQIRGFMWSQARLALKKKTFFERTSNEWINLYVLAICAVRVVQEIGFMSPGIIDPKASFIMTKFISGTLVCCLFTIAWGWYKVILPTTDKAKKVARADKVHTVFRLISVFSEIGFGAASVLSLSEDEAKAGIYNGTFHGISRIIMWIIAAMLLGMIRHIGLKIKGMLASGGAKTSNKVAPEKEGAPKEKKKQSDEEKIAYMVKWVTGIMVVVLLYLIKDIMDSIGKVRHVDPPLCAAKDAFVRLPSIIQIFASAACSYVFPVKKPDQKGKTGMMGTTVMTSSTATD